MQEQILVPDKELIQKFFRKQVGMIFLVALMVTSAMYFYLFVAYPRTVAYILANKPYDPLVVLVPFFLMGFLMALFNRNAIRLVKLRFNETGIAYSFGREDVKGVAKHFVPREKTISWKDFQGYKLTPFVVQETVFKKKLCILPVFQKRDIDEMVAKFSRGV